MCSQSLRISQWIANLAMVANLAFAKLAKWFANLAKWFANLAKWFAKLAKWFANLAMRNFAKLLKFYVRQMNSACGLRISQCQFRNANFARVANSLPTDCQLIAKISALLFFQNMLQNFQKKLLN